MPPHRPTARERWIAPVTNLIGRHRRADDLYFDCGAWPWYATPRRFEDFPTRPRRIFCKHLDYNEGFREWVAWCVQEGSELHIMQHGGGFGSMLRMGLEDHYLSICDKFYSWGWGADNPKIVPGYSPWLRAMATACRGIEGARDGAIYWILNAVPREHYREASMPQGEAFQEYLDDQFELASLLPHHTRRRIVVRPYPEDYGWHIREQWAAKFPDICVEEPGIPVTRGLGRASVIIVTGNLTTLLEAAAINATFVAFWNPAHWPLRPAAQPFYDALHRDGMLTYTPTDAARLLRGGQYRHALGAFRHEFART